MTPLPNPERAWERAHALGELDRAEVERRVGPTAEGIERLSGGLANENVRIGDRVLRIYRRDPRAREKEAALLAHPWRSLRVPRIEAAGEDFLVLGYVPHGPVLGSSAHGAAVGRALAEIHASRSFQRAGLVGADLEIEVPFDDLVDAFADHLRGEARSVAAELAQPCLLALEVIERSASWLRARAQPNVLLHGDFKASNLHWTEGGELLVLDWEFAYAGPALLDIGQLLRWSPPPVFVGAFADAYVSSGGVLVEGWQRAAALLDLGNLAGLLSDISPSSRRAKDVVARIEATLAGAQITRSFGGPT